MSVPLTAGGNPNWRKQRVERARAWALARKEAGLGFEPMPRPDGLMPNDDPLVVCSPLQWDGRRWQVWCLLHDGKTSKEAAEIAGISYEKVKEWRTLWLIRYGRHIKTTKVSQTKRDQGYKLTPETSTPVIRRSAASEELDEAGAQVISMIQRYLRMVGEDQERLLAMSPAEALKLLELGEKAFEAAARLQHTGTLGVSGGPNSSAKAALTGLTGGRKTGSKTNSTIDPSAASAGLSGLKSTLSKFQQAREAAQESAAG